MHTKIRNETLFIKIHKLAEMVCEYYHADLIRYEQRVTNEFMQRAELVVQENINSYELIKHRKLEYMLKDELEIINITLDCITENNFLLEESIDYLEDIYQKVVPDNFTGFG